MEKKNLIKYVLVGIIILVVFVVMIVLLGKNSNNSRIDLYKVSKNYSVDNDMIMGLYNRYNPENELLFNIIGSDHTDMFGYYYKKDKTTYKDLNNNIKSVILFNDADYKSGEFDSNRNCYYMSVSSFKTIYKKLYGYDDYDIKFSEDFEPRVYVDGDSLCIGSKENVLYNKVIDTYMVNAIKDGDTITVYERVAFIKVDKDILYFYKDYSMTNLVYALKVTKDLDTSFINNSNIVSNVLLKYQDKFELYEYTYVLGEDSYYFESIER